MVYPQSTALPITPPLSPKLRPVHRDSSYRPLPQTSFERRNSFSNHQTTWSLSKRLQASSARTARPTSRHRSRNSYSVTVSEQHKSNMQNVHIPADSVPAGLKSLEQTLRRAQELKQAEPIVSYWCCFSVAQKALKVQNRTKEDTMFLMSLVDALEQMKAILGNNEGITSEAAGAAYIENFALKIFMSADNDDRSGNTGKATLRKFVVSGQFIEVLRCFEHGMTDEMEQKLQYARWKAADGARALREGRTPKAGPPIPDDDFSPFPEAPAASPGGVSSQLLQSPPNALGGSRNGSFSSNQRPPPPSPPVGTVPVLSPRPSPALSARNNVMGIDTSDSILTRRGKLSESGAWSTVATPGLPDDEDVPAHFDLGKPASHMPSGSSGTPPEGSPPLGGEKKNVRFMGPDGAPLSPASTHITVASYDTPPPPPPTDISSPQPSPKPLAPVVLGPPPQGRPRGDSSSSTRSAGDRHQQHPAHPPDPKYPPANAASIPRPKAGAAPATQRAMPSSVNVRPVPQPSLAHPPTHPHPHGLGLSSPAPTPKSLSRRDVEQTQKHAKWAISAMEFDDYETARNELRKALNLLGG